MKTLKNSTIWIITVLFLSFASCEKDPIEPPTPPPAKYSFEIGAAKQASFFGEVVDDNSQPVAGAEITIGSSTTTTNSDGIFFIENANVHSNHAYIKAEKSGYFLGSRSIVPQDGTNKVRIMLLDKTPIGSFDASTGGTLSGDGISIAFASGIVDASGAAYSGNVNVAANYIDPEGEFLLEEMPGNLIGADADGGKYLQTFGMAAVELTDDSGNKLQLAEDSPAEMTFPLSAALMADAPTTIPLWSFDEDNGYWIYEGEANLEGNTYVASVSHFSFWNCDIPTTYTNVEGRVINSSGDGVSGAIVEIVSASFGTGIGYTNSDGYYGGIIPAGELLTINVLIDCGGPTTSVHTASVGPFAGVSNIIPDITVSSASAIMVSGTIVDCSSAPVINGYVVVNGTTHPLMGGMFSVLACSGSTVDVQGYDLDALNESGLATFTTGGVDMSVGSIMACTGLSEYIVWNINGTGYSCTSNFYAYTQGPSVGFSGDAPDYWSFNSNAFTGPGTYTMDGVSSDYLFMTGLTNDSVSTVNIVLTLTDYGSTTGDLIDGSFAGTVTPSGSPVENISGSFHFFHQ